MLQNITHTQHLKDLDTFWIKFNIKSQFNTSNTNLILKIPRSEKSFPNKNCFSLFTYQYKTFDLFFSSY